MDLLAVRPMQIEILAETRRLPEDHVTRPDIGAVGVAAIRADQEIGKAVAVDISRPGDGKTGSVTRHLAVVSSEDHDRCRLPQS